MRKSRQALGLLLLLLIIPLLPLSSFMLPPQYADTYLAALPDKISALDETASPKIVLIGGSGTAFDVDCSLLSEQLPAYEAVNFGLYAGLGTAVMLELALPAIRDGDVVVFSPELSEQTLSDWFDPTAMWQACETCPALISRLRSGRREQMLAAFPQYAAQKTRFALLGQAPAGAGVYSRSAFTDRGDIRMELRPANIMPGGYDANVPIRFESAWLTADFASRVNTFAAACRNRGAVLYFRFCPMNAAALDAEERTRIPAFTDALEAALICPVLGSAETALMDSAWFYDTNFHLNSAGAAANTLLFAGELKQALHDSTPLTVPFPEAPGPAEQALFDGDSSDEACFLYEKHDGSLYLSGLSADGLNRTSLILPASHEGLPVVSLNADAFAGNTLLQSITLQANIRSIPDGAFAGCSSLAAIILLQDDPALCSVGAGLLRGTNAAVHVPAASYGRYCTDYFWSVHAARLQPAAAGSAAPETAGPAAGESRIPTATSLTYEGCGGVLRGRDGSRMTCEISYVHLRENTLQGTVWFAREGYVLYGWNTSEDGNGTAIGLGSRYGMTEGSTLYAQWLACTDDEAFAWEINATYAAVTAYRGTDAICVIPETHAGLPVRVIRTGAFQGASFSRLVFPPSMRTVEPGAFQDCVIEELTLSDSLETISDACFQGGASPRTLRINAATRPVYSGSYFDAFQDKYDRLLSLKGQGKLILASGSSGRYGYDSAMLKAAFPELEPVNMGVYAYTNALPQLRLMLPLTEEGDILIYAPEFDAANEQFCVSDRLDTGFWAMMESSYDTAAALDMRAFSCVFDSLGEYLRIRQRMPGKSYDVSPARFDDDGNAYDFSTYNQYGDFVLPRPDGDTDGRLRHNIADYTADTVTSACIRCLNTALSPFKERGVEVLFSYSPRNSASLTDASTPDARRHLEEKLRKELAVPVVSSLEDSLLPGHLFWLIDSHLSTAGAKIRTERIIEDLKRSGY